MAQLHPTPEFVKQRQEEASQTGVLDFYLVRNLRSQDLLPFPLGLRVINLSCTDVSWLPELPEGLEELRCDKASLQRLPRLPSTLKELHIRRNPDMKTLPELPDSLEVLDMQDSQVEVLPKLPRSLQYLQIGGTLIREVLELPPNLTQLNAEAHWRADHGFLERLGPLPPSLKELKCQGCIHLTSIGPFHEGLQVVNLSGTGITELPLLPESVVTLYCDLYPEDCKTPAEFRQVQLSRHRTMERCRAMKEELIAAVWHPRRMAFWSYYENMN